MIQKESFYFLSFLILFFSCVQQKQKFNNKAKYYDNGNIKEKWFFGDNVFDSISYQDKDLKNKSVDSTKVLYFKKPKNTIGVLVFYLQKKHKTLVFYANGILGREGFAIKDSLSIGKWKYYTNKGQLKSISEYKNIKGKSYLNQGWYFNKAGDTIGGSYFNLTYRDTFKLRESLKLLVSVPISFYENEATKIMACIPTSDSPNFNDDFSNRDEIDEACSYDVETSQVNKKFVFVDDFNRAAIIQKKFKTSGKKLVRGIIYEYLVKEKDSLGLDKALENAHKMYFEIPVFVKDSV